MRVNLIRAFIVTAGSLLLSTAAAKILSAFGHSKIITLPDPILTLPHKYVFLMVGGIELVVALVCLVSRRTLAIKAGLIAWLATSFLIYRLGLVWVVYQKPCSCLGNLTDALHISPQIADTAMKIILAYLLIGSYATLFSLWRQRKTSVSSAVGAASL